MNEWMVVTVIATLTGICASVIRPLISLNGTITRLTAAVNILVLDSLVGGDIYSCVHPLKTFVAFYKWRKKFLKCKKETAKVRCLSSLTDSK